MTAAEYRAAGYSVALQMEQSVIDRAEGDVRIAYIVPLLGPDYDATDAAVRACVMGLSYLLMQERIAQVTRAGGKQKLITQSNTPSFGELLEQNADTCVMYLERLAKTNGIRRWWAVVDDICRVIFSTNYIKA